MAGRTPYLPSSHLRRAISSSELWKSRKKKKQRSDEKTRLSPFACGPRQLTLLSPTPLKTLHQGRPESRFFIRFSSSSSFSSWSLSPETRPLWPPSPLAGMRHGVLSPPGAQHSCVLEPLLLSRGFFFVGVSLIRGLKSPTWQHQVERCC